MRILIPAPRGFCAGVSMAIDCLDEALRLFGPDIYVYHQIVHNRSVVEHFENRGVTFVDNIDDVPAGAVVLFSAHGVSPEVRRRARERQLYAIDATCPLVTKVHMEAVHFARTGYRIILIGHAGHDEVVGALGEAPHCMTLVESVEDVDGLPFSRDAKLAYLTQTTLSVAETRGILDRLKQRYPQIVGPSRQDICYATTNRQEAVGQLLPRADVLVVLGSGNSSNSRRLTELGRCAGKPAYQIDGSTDLETGWFSEEETVILASGASVPEPLLQECLAWFAERFSITTEEVTLRDETVTFPLPEELRRLQLSA